MIFDLVTILRELFRKMFFFRFFLKKKLFVHSTFRSSSTHNTPIAPLLEQEMHKGARVKYAGTQILKIQIRKYTNAKCVFEKIHQTKTLNAHITVGCIRIAQRCRREGNCTK